MGFGLRVSIAKDPGADLAGQGQPALRVGANRLFEPPDVYHRSSKASPRRT